MTPVPTADQTVTGGGLVRNALPGQAALAPWLRQLTGTVTPLTHPNPPAAPWYTDAMNAKQAAQAEMVRQWKADQDAQAAAAAAFAAAHPGASPQDSKAKAAWNKYHGSAVEDMLSGGTEHVAEGLGLK